MKIEVDNPELLADILTRVWRNSESSRELNILDTENKRVLDHIAELEKGEGGNLRRIQCFSEGAHGSHRWTISNVDAPEVERLIQDVWCKGVMR
jgi:hypothetical protein